MSHKRDLSVPPNRHSILFEAPCICSCRPPPQYLHGKARSPIPFLTLLSLSRAPSRSCRINLCLPQDGRRRLTGRLRSLGQLQEDPLVLQLDDHLHAALVALHKLSAGVGSRLELYDLSAALTPPAALMVTYSCSVCTMLESREGRPRLPGHLG